ncbi:MAG: 30S ribosomal protein S7 [Lentisphaeraceae bacterium]|nr:30S ribosomal protein S7 [Lentisphaeraceae bacterium]
MRKKRAPKREVLPDAKYNSELMSRLINMVMVDGKKSTSEKIVYTAMKEIAKKFPDVEPLEVFFQALENIKPQVQVKSRRVGGATYQVPVEVAPERQMALAMRWLISYSRGRKGKPMHLSLSGELIDAYNNTGSAVKKKDDTHRMAAANKAFAHYRW